MFIQRANNNFDIQLADIPVSPFTNTYSLDFDGVDDYADLGSSTDLELTTDFSISVWIKETSSGTNRGILCCSNRSASNGWELRRTSGNKVAFYCGARTATSTSLINTGDWINVIATWETSVGGGIGNRNRIYVNGVLEGTATTGVAFSPIYTGTIYKQMAYPYANSNNFLGGIDEVAVFPSLLSSEDITTISTAPINLIDYSPIAWYRNGDNGAYKSPQWLIPNNENKDKVSNYSLSFDGIGDYINIGNAISFEYTDAFSFSTWIKPLPKSGVKYLYSKYLGGKGILIYLNSSSANGINTLNFNLYNTNSGSIATRKRIVTNDINFAPVNVWTNIVLTYDGSGLASGINYYKNGVLQSSAVIQDNLQNNTIVNTNDAYLSSFSGISSFLLGNQDEFAIYSTELSSADALAIYNSGEPTTISGAVAHYKMGEEANFTSNWLVDNSALDNYSKRSFELDGIGDYVDLGDSDDFSFGNGTTDSPFTISAWIKMDSTSGFRIFNKSLGATSEYQFGTGGGGTLQLYLFNSTSNFIYRARVYTTVLNTGQWYHVAATYSGVGGTNAQDGIKIYVDGVRVDDSSVSGGTYVAMGNTTAPAYIGKLDSSYANGSIDEVSVFNSVVDIADLWDGSGEPIDVSGVSGIVSNYRMGEDASFNGANWTVPDSVGSNNGTTNSMMVDALVGEAPNYSSGGISNAMTIEDRIGEAPNSTDNALSFNMDSGDRLEDTP